MKVQSFGFLASTVHLIPFTMILLVFTSSCLRRRSERPHVRSAAINVIQIHMIDVTNLQLYSWLPVRSERGGKVMSILNEGVEMGGSGYMTI